MVIPSNVLSSLGFKRKKCKRCGRYFWTLDEKREVCMDHEEYSFINNPIGKKLSYSDVWDNFKVFMRKKGYEPIKRYPVVARWRDDLEFVIASIADFQPWVTKGIVPPPSKKLTIPQFCLRFNDIGNVGFTGRHYTGFVMIGQHAFVKPEEYNTEEYFKDLLDWFLNLDIPLNEFVFHEDKWEGGGNAGYSIEFFVRGLEVANQVYMIYEVKNGKWVEMDNIKILDMGMGQERVAWVLNGTPTSYDIVFPNTLEYLRNNIKLDLDWDVFVKVAPYMSRYDFEDKSLKEFIHDLNKIMGRDVYDIVHALGAMYSISDHARTLLIAISDGSLPSNIGGGYNLRLVLRRMYEFIERYFDIDIHELFNKILEDWYEKHLESNLEEVLDIVEYEINKYIDMKKRARKILSKLEISKLSPNKLFDLYQSHGITIELIQSVYPDFDPPKEFYKLLEEHRSKSKSAKTKKDVYVDVSEFPKTIKEFYEDWKKYYTTAKYLGYKDGYIVVDKTVFYPLKGGQKYDVGWIFNLNLLKQYSPASIEALDLPKYVKTLVSQFTKGKESDNIKKTFLKVHEVYDINNVIIHKVDRQPNWNIGSELLLVIDKDKRYNISRNHTATHILTGVLRRKYGKHVWQTGAEKDENKARLDITHHKLPTMEELLEIEKEVNKIILEMRPIKKFYMRRDEAESKYGFAIYQGGFIPEVNLRIVEIEDLDVEACSGTHLENTIEVGYFKILGVKRIADGIIRFEYTTGKNAVERSLYDKNIIQNLTKILNTNEDYLIRAVEKLREERELYSKKYNKLLENIINILISRGIKEFYLPVDIRDILPIIMKIKPENIHLVTNNGEISTRPLENSKKIGNYYVVFKK